jgi:hypothetical protein
MHRVCGVLDTGAVHGGVLAQELKAGYARQLIASSA